MTPQPPAPTLEAPYTAEEWLRHRYGAYRGHFAWRELEQAFEAGRASLAKEPASQASGLLHELDQLLQDAERAERYLGSTPLPVASDVYEALSHACDRARNAVAAALSTHPAPEWTATSKKLHPDKPGEFLYEQVPCLIVKGGDVLLRQWNCKHLVWDDEDGDDFFCLAQDVSHWMLLPTPPKGQGEKP